MNMKKIAVLGAGNAGMTTAADLSLRGYEVRLFSRTESLLIAIQDAGGIRACGVIEGLAKISMLRCEIDAVIDGVDLIVIAVPSTAHAAYAKLLAPHLEAGSLIFLNPGHTWGGFHFLHELQKAGGTTEISLVESATLTYTCRKLTPSSVRCSNIISRLRSAAIPNQYQEEIIENVKAVFPNIISAVNSLETSLMNINAIMHPLPFIMNASRIENNEDDFCFYYDGTTPTVGKAIDLTDRERLEIGSAFGLKLPTFGEQMYDEGYTTAEACRTNKAYHVLRESEPNRFIKAPQTLDHRYLHEDIGYGLVPMRELARIGGVPTPIMDSTILLASALSGHDYQIEGLNMGKMGLSKTTNKEDLVQILQNGFS